MAAKKTKNNKKNADSEDRLSLLGILQGVFQGRIFLTLEFFKRYWLYIIAATVMMLMYISNKYVYQSDMAKLKELKTSLNNARTDYVDASSNYNSRILESQMKQRVDSMGIDLNISNQPPYELKSEN
jgi:hypothetical protein